VKWKKPTRISTVFPNDLSGTYHVTSESSIRGIRTSDFIGETSGREVIGVISSVVVAHVVEGANAGGLTSSDDFGEGLLEGSEGESRGFGLVGDGGDGTEVEGAEGFVAGDGVTGAVLWKKK
jgi:hypothetical protein